MSAEAPPSDRTRERRWEASNVTVEAVVSRLHDLQAELSRQEVGDHDHPHPRNCVLNLVVVVADTNRARVCDRLIGELAASHPLRAIVVHAGASSAADGMDAEIVSEAHRLLNGFPVQREQVLLRVRGDAAEHLASLVEPLLVPDVPTYLWWSGRKRLDASAVLEAMTFTDVLLVDSELLEHPREAMLELARLAADPAAPVGIADFRWGRLKPWRDPVAQFFTPHERRPLLTGVRELAIDAAGSGPDGRVGAVLVAGWMAGALGWRISHTTVRDDATEARAETPGGHRVRIVLRSVGNDHLHRGELLSLRLTGGTGHRAFTLTVESSPHGDPYARVTIELGETEPVRQRLTLPQPSESDLLVHVLLGSRSDPVFQRTLAGATALLEATP
jgi:glucose-6-phosphate dehydrogenase assembly protein OpcA